MTPNGTCASGLSRRSALTKTERRGYKLFAMPRRLAAVLIVAFLASGALLAASLVFQLRDSDDENGTLRHDVGPRATKQSRR